MGHGTRFSSLYGHHDRGEEMKRLKRALTEETRKKSDESKFQTGL